MNTLIPILTYIFIGISTSIELNAQASTIANDKLLEAINHYTGVAGIVNDIRAKELLLEVSQDQNDIIAQMWISRVHSTGRMGFKKDLTKAKRIATGILNQVRTLAEFGDIEAIFLIGTAYDEGLGIEIDYKQALEWYKTAAKEGHILAIHNVGNMYRDGRGVMVDHAEATKWWEKAAESGDVIPALRLGEAYEAGRGVPRDLETAISWYSRAAKAGNALAIDALKRLLSPGILSSSQSMESCKSLHVQNFDGVTEQKDHTPNLVTA